jgi:hypothetical protein
MACVLLKHVLSMYGFVCNEHRDSFIFSCNTVWLFFVSYVLFFFLHLELTSFCLFGLIVMVRNFICINFCHHLYKAFLFYLSSFMLHSSKNVTYYVACDMQKFTIWWDERALSELLHQIYLYHQKIMFLLILLFGNLTIKCCVGENEFKNKYELCTRWVSYWEVV